MKMQTESEPAHIFVRSSTLMLNERTGREISKYTQNLTAFPTLDMKMQTESEPAHIFVRSSTLMLNERTGREISKYTQNLTAFPTLCESSTAINHGK